MAVVCLLPGGFGGRRCRMEQIRFSRYGVWYSAALDSTDGGGGSLDMWDTYSTSLRGAGHTLSTQRVYFSIGRIGAYCWQ